jgi:hypothetical protein
MENVVMFSWALGLVVVVYILVKRHLLNNKED